MRRASLSTTAGLALACLLASLAVPMQGHAGKGTTTSPYEIYVDTTGNGLAFATDAPSDELLHFKARISLPNGESFEQTSKSGYIEWAASPDLPNATVKYEAWVVTAEPGAPMRQDAPTSGQVRTLAKQGQSDDDQSDADTSGLKGSARKVEPTREYYADEFKQLSRESGAAELHNGSVSLTAPSVEDVNRPEERPLSALDGAARNLERMAGTVLNWMVSPAKAQQVFNDDVESESTDPDFILDDTDATVDWFLNQYNSGDFSIRDDGVDDVFYLETGGPANALYVDSSGDVGLRTGTPAATLHLSETVPVMRLEDTNDGQSWDILNTNATRFEIDGATTFTADCNDDGTDESCTPKPFSIEPATTNFEAEAQDQAFYITAGGDIGLRTDNPAAAFHLVGTGQPTLFRVEEPSDDIFDFGISSGGDFIIEQVDGGANGTRLHIDDTNSRTELRDDITEVQGDLGVGASSPDKQLHVQGASADTLGQNNTMMRVENTTGTQGARRMLELVNNGSPLLVYKDTARGNIWNMSPVANSFAISLTGTGAQEFSLDGGGNLTIQGSLTQNSSRASKKAFSTVDADTVLSKLDELSVEEWSYKHTPDLRHVSPMAEDFHATFGLGPKDGIAPTDLAGVALAAAKALKAENEALKAKVSEMDQMKNRLGTLENRLNELTE